MNAAIPENISTVTDILFFRAGDAPDAIAYWVDGESISYAKLAEEVVTTAMRLIRLGIKKSDICVIVFPTSLDSAIFVYSLQLIGAIPVMVNPDLPDYRVLARAAMVRSRLVIVSDVTASRLRNKATNESRCCFRIESNKNLRNRSGRSKLDPNTTCHHDAAYIQFTSGTTGEPKAALISHRNLINFLKLAQNRFGITSRDILVSWLPFYHDLGLVRFLFGPIFFGCPVYLLQPSITSIGMWLKTISDKRGTITSGPDFAYRMATRMTESAGIDLSSLRIATNGGETVRMSTIAKFERKFGISCVIMPCYGLAEATLGVSSTVPGEPIIVDNSGNVSCGSPYDGIEVKIVNGKAGERTDGLVGEIAIRGPTVFSGYLNDKASSEKVLKGGWLYTGDVGTIDNRGHLYILGRKRAMIKRAGALIIPREIEEAADKVEGIRFSAAIGVSRRARGLEEIIVIAEIKPGLAKSENEYKKAAASIVASVKHAIGFSPNEVVIVMPRTISRTRNGKIRYDALKKLYCSEELKAQGKILYGRCCQPAARSNRLSDCRRVS